MKLDKMAHSFEKYKWQKCEYLRGNMKEVETKSQITSNRNINSSRKTRKKKLAKTTYKARVLDNISAQDVEQILQTETYSNSLPVNSMLTVIVNKTHSLIEDIITKDTPKTQDNQQRLHAGMRIVKNKAFQKPEKIKRVDIVADTNDEMTYKKLITRFEEAFITRNIEAIDKCLSPVFEWRLPNGEVVYGKNEALDEMDRRFAMPNGPKFSRSVWRFKGRTVIQTYRVKFMGPDGKWRKSRGMDLYKIRNGLITRKDAYWKMIP